MLISFKVLSSWQLIEAKDYFNVIEKLHADLLKNYNKQIRPVVNHNHTVNIEAGLSLTNIHFVFEIVYFASAIYKLIKLN